jgi:hypothetical protein
LNEMLRLKRNKCNCNKYVYIYIYIERERERGGGRGSVVGCGTMLQAGRSPVGFPMRSMDFSIDLIFSAALWPRIDSASNRNEHQESSWAVKGGSGGFSRAGACLNATPDQLSENFVIINYTKFPYTLMKTVIGVVTFLRCCITC